MINFFDWGKDRNQIMLERTAFYFIKKMPIAFREPHKQIFTFSAHRHTQTERDFLTDLGHSGEIVFLTMTEFKKNIQKAYDNALFYGVRRVAKKKFGMLEKEQKNVTNKQNHAGVSED